METATVASPVASSEPASSGPSFFSNLARTTEFWTRCLGVYIGYKATQVSRLSRTENDLLTRCVMETHKYNDGY